MLRARPALFIAAALLSAGPVAAAPSATSPEFVNFNNSQHLLDVNVMPAWAAGATGRGITVAVIDSGVELSHAELSGRIAGGGRNLVLGGNPGDDFTGHGTQVSGLIAANNNDAGIVGIAYEAQILPLKAFDGFLGGGVEILDALNIAAGRADVRVVNMSFGGPEASPLELLALQRTAAAGKVLVMSAGNTGAPEPEFPARFAAQLGGSAIAVGALGADGQIAFFSNRAGSAQDAFLLAPGFDVWTTTIGGTFEPVFGTSFAASYVSGAAALLAQAFPNLTGPEITSLLLVTADDLGPPGPDTVNGHGRLNIGRAFEPVGSLAIPAGASPRAATAPLATEALIIAPALAGGLLSQPELLAGTVALDSFDRAYTLDLRELVGVRSPRRDFSDLFAPHVLDFQGSRIALPGGWSLQAGHTGGSVAGDRLDRDQFGPQRLLRPDDVVLLFDGATGRGATGTGFRLGFNALASRAPGQVAASPAVSAQFLNRAALTTPYLGFAAREDHAFVGLPLSGRARLKLGITRQDSDETFGLNSSAAVAETSFALHPRLDLQLRYSQLWERGSLLGGASGGSFSVADAETRALGIAVKARLSERLRLIANADVGRTRVTSAASSLLGDFNRLDSNAYGIGLLGHDLMRRGDSAGIAVLQPLRIYRGGATLDLPVSMDAEENIGRRGTRLSLTPAGREIDFEAYYQIPLNRSTSLATNLLWQHHPDHLQQNGRLTVMASLRRVF